MKRMTSMLIGLTILTFGLPGAHAAEPPHPAVLIPAEIELGLRAPGSTTQSSLWIVNTGDEPLELVRAKGSCGCTGVRFQPTVLSSQAALEVPFHIRAPRAAGRSKNVTVTITMEDHPPLILPVRLRTTGDDLVPDADVIADPAVADIGPINAGSFISTSVHLVNVGTVARQVTAVRAACKCTTFPGFAPLTLQPHDETDIHMEVEVPDTIGGEVFKNVTVIVSGQRAITIPLRMDVSHPLVETLKVRLNKLHADAFVYDEFRVDTNTVTAVAWEPDRSVPAARVICRFDDNGAIEDLVIKTITPHRAEPEPAG